MTDVDPPNIQPFYLQHHRSVQYNRSTAHTQIISMMTYTRATKTQSTIVLQQAIGVFLSMVQFFIYTVAHSNTTNEVQGTHKIIA